MNKSAQILLYRIILGCPLLLVAPESLAAPSDPDWKEFQIPDLGTRVDYPAAVFLAEVSRLHHGNCGHRTFFKSNYALLQYAKKYGRDDSDDEGTRR